MKHIHIYFLLLLFHSAHAFAQPNTLPQQEKKEGFVLLFDGKALSPEIWQCGIDGHVVENGAFVCKGGRKDHLLTRKQYENFVLRFEFKCPPGGNNGIGIRASDATKDVAYYGMEIQVLDPGSQSDPLYWHGSIYNIAASKENGHLHKTGQWNHEEIIADGSKIKATLNGTTILDANIKGIYKENHPGLHNERGFVGFLAHNDPVAFRNVRIKELPPNPEKATESGMRQWTGSNGKVIEAEVLGLDGDVVRIKLKNGREMNVLLSRFAEKDQNHLRRFGITEDPFENNGDTPTTLGPELLKVNEFKEGYKPSWKNHDWHWQDSYNNEKLATLTVTDNSLRIDCGNSIHGIPQLFYEPIGLAKGKRYRFEYEAKSETEGRIAPQLVVTAPQWQRFGFWPQKIEKEWSRYSYDFTVNESVEKGKLNFRSFDSKNVYEIRRVSLREILTESNDSKIDSEHGQSSISRSKVD